MAYIDITALLFTIQCTPLIVVCQEKNGPSWDFFEGLSMQPASPFLQRDKTPLSETPGLGLRPAIAQAQLPQKRKRPQVAYRCGRPLFSVHLPHVCRQRDALLG